MPPHTPAAAAALIPLHPKVGDLVNFHERIGGPVTSHDHEVCLIMYRPAGGNLAWISGKSRFVHMAALSRPKQGGRA